MKTSIRWQKSMSVHVAELDEQHKTIIRSINNLADLLKQQGKAETIVKFLNELEACMEDHFRSEEAILTQNGYPELSDHRLKHQEMRRNLHEFQAGLAQGDLLSLIKLLPFLIEYFHDHLLEQDGLYARYLQKRNQG